MNDTERLDWLAEFFKHCPDAQLSFNDDADVDDEPVGYSLRVDGCAGKMCASAENLRDAIDLMADALNQPRKTEANNSPPPEK